MPQRFAEMPRSISLVLALTAAMPVAFSAQNRLGPLASRVFADFAALSPSGFRTMLDRLRKPALSPQERSLVRAALPRDGELIPSRRQAEKLSALQQVLQYHRRDGQIEVKVVDAFQLAVGLHARSFILISAPALRLLDSEELQALAAHELGHDYFWNEFQEAVGTNNEERAQELELRCDAVAVFTLTDLGLNPRKLLSALTTGYALNTRFGPPLNGKLYVPEQERVRFLQALIASVCPAGHPCR
jgi:hypothetical protein